MAPPSAELISCLQATLSPDAVTRHQAESMLQQGGTQEGFAVGLISVAQAEEVPLGVRQLAAVLLRHHIKNHWSLEGSDEVQVCMSDSEKSQVRAMLPTGLADDNSRIQTAVGMAIAEIAKWDAPGEWPELLPGLVQAITSKTNIALVSGAVRCLSMMVEDLSEVQVVEISAIVLPQLLQIVGAEGCPPGLQRQALRIFKCTLASLELVYTQQPAAKALLSSFLGPWLGAITTVLSVPPTMEMAPFWAVQFEALGCLIQLIPPFSKHAGQHLHPVMAVTWQMLTSLLPLYQKAVVSGDEDGDADGSAYIGGDDGSGADPVTLPDLVSQLLELVLTLVGSSRLVAMVRPSFPELLYLALGYMQMGVEEEERWEEDVNAYLGQDDEFWGPRASGEILIDELLEREGAPAVAAVADAIRRRTQEIAAARSAGGADWWRLRESILFAMGAAAERIVSLKKRGKALPQELDPEFLAPGLLADDLSPGAPPFVAGRAMWLLSRWEPVLSSQAKTGALRAVAAALTPGSSAPLQAGACQAMCKLCRGAAPQDLQAVSETAVHGLCALLPAATEDSLHLILETLTAVVAADTAGAARWEPHLTPAALKSWIDNVNDPLISVDVFDLIQALANVPGCLPVLQSRAMPTLLDIVSNPAPHSSILISGCLDMLVMLLAPSLPEAGRALCSAAASPVLALLAASDDEEVIASATAFLRTMLQVGKESALEWSGQDPAAASGTMLQAVDRLLRPELPDRACRFVGGFILELLRHAGPLMAPHVAPLASAVVRRLVIADDPQTMQSLLTVIAHLARHDASQLVDLLAGAEAPGGVSALQAAMQKWTERQIEVRTPYDIRLTTTALGQIVACPHPALDSVTVRGKRVDTASAIRTRARAVTQCEEWSQVPLRVKIVMLLSDAYIEATTQGNGQGEDEEEWLDEDDSEEGSESEGEEDGGGAGGFSGWGQFSEYGEFLGADFEGMDAMDLSNVDHLEAERRKEDPLSSLDVAAYVSDVLKGLSAAAPQLLQKAALELTPVQLEAVQKIWQA